MTDDPIRRAQPISPPAFAIRPLAPFARMPPVVFPVVLGLLGLSLALKRAAIVWDLPQAPADLAMGMVAGLWLFCAAAYGVKLARRPAVLREELRILPGRAGVAAATVGSLAFAAVLGFFHVPLARAALVIGLALHSVSALAMIAALRAAPPEARDVTPVWHLTFVGFIVGALAAVPLGWIGLAILLLLATMAAAGVIWAVSLWQLIRRIPPAPLRPLLVIHLAPASLFASVAGLLGQTGLAQAMVLLALGIAAVLLGAAKWITRSGFSPLWGAFGFPTAALASALLINSWTVAGTVATLAVLAGFSVIAWRILSMWPKGTLASKTNAATA